MSGYSSFLKNLKGFLTIFIKNKRNILLKEISKRPRGFREILNKPSIETSMTKKTTYTFNVSWIGHFLNSLNFSSINFNTSFRNFMPKNDTFIYHKVSLLPIQDKISFLTSLQNQVKIV